MIKMGVRRLEGGFEYAEIMVSDSAVIDRWLDQGEEFPHTVKHTLAGWYLDESRPMADDIVEVKIRTQGSWYVISLKIKRGKEILAKLIREHKNLSIEVGAQKVEVFEMGNIYTLPRECF